MQTEPTVGRKPADVEKGVIPAKAPDIAGNLLTRAHFGVHVTGRVDSISPVRHSEGKTEKGRDYSFYQQTVTLALGGQMVEVNFRADKDPGNPLVEAELDEIVRYKVGAPRVFNGRVSFDAILV